MKMEYFTKNGVNQVIEKFGNLIGKEFYFDSSEIKHKLDEIIEQEMAGDADCFDIKFNSYSDDKLFSLTISKFMLLNKKTEYNFHDYETRIIEM